MKPVYCIDIHAHVSADDKTAAVDQLILVLAEIIEGYDRLGETLPCPDSLHKFGMNLDEMEVLH